MISIDQIADKNIILSPFCANSVLLHHRFLIDGIKVCGYFDRNPLLENHKYNEVFIQRMYYRVNTIIILCSDIHNQAIRDDLLEIGYSADHILCIEDVSTSANNYDASEKADIELFSALMPAQVVAGDNSDVLKIRKLKKLKQLGAPKAGLTYEEFDGMWRKDNFIDERGNTHIFIKRFELDVTSKCSLRCKHCGALMQYFTCPQDIPVTTIISDYNRMLQLIDWTDEVLIMGGEPFMNRELSAVLEAVKNHPETDKKVGMIRIVTNGTILPDNKTVDLLAESNITVWISNYKEHSKRIVELIHLFQMHHIKFEVLGLSYWANVQQLVQRDEPLSTDELLERRRTCWKRHHAVSEGKFFLCAFSNFANKLGAVPYDEGNFVNIYDENAKEKIVKYLDSSTALPISCSWCNGNFPESWEGENRFPVAEQTHEVLQYHKFE